jgi:hypothetical protein
LDTNCHDARLALLADAGRALIGWTGDNGSDKAPQKRRFVQRGSPMKTGHPCLTPCLTLASFNALFFTKALILLLHIEVERVKGIESWL